MLKGLMLILMTFMVLAATLSIAQTAPAKKPVKTANVRPNTKVPSKVTGDGVKTESGLQYWDITEGTGKVAKEGDGVRVHYTGWLTTGQKFEKGGCGGGP